MMYYNELEPCPFCGCEVEIVCIGGGWFWRHKNDPDDSSCVITHSKKYASYDEAAKMWNIRVRNTNRSSEEQNIDFVANRACAIQILEFIQSAYRKSANKQGVQKYIIALQMGIDALKEEEK